MIKMKTAFQRFIRIPLLTVTVATITACSSTSQAPAPVEGKQVTGVAPIRINQLGYYPSARKVAIVPASAAVTFSVVRAADGTQAFVGTLSSAQQWEYSGESVQQADFSALTSPGDYLIRVDGVGKSYPFTIANDVLEAVHDAALKSYYINRSGMQIDPQFGGVHARASGHPDTSVKIHASAATEARPEGTVISAPRGWYDAGDYGKYTVNSGISTYTLLAAYQHFKPFYQNRDVAIPESGNGLPDIIDEIKWNLDWMEAMQDTDGGVYHKLTALNFSDIDVMPENETSQRYAIGKSVTATLDFAAVMAVASRVMATMPAEFAVLADQYRAKAERAYQWAQKNPTALYTQPEDVATGAYDDTDAADEFAWAAAELYLLTGDSAYLADFLEADATPSDHLFWQSVAALPYISLAREGASRLDANQLKTVTDKLVAAADAHYTDFAASAYDVAAEASDFVWGSNSNVLNNGLVLWQAYELTGDEKYKTAALSTLDYVLGKNATGYSFVTDYGDHTPMLIHHRPSVADDTPIPVPGFLAGGPHTGRQDNCDYPGDQPATNFVDAVCSYSTNEIAINWNAPLVYLLAAAASRSAQ